MQSKTKSHLRAFALAAVGMWVPGTFAYIYFVPHFMSNALNRALRHTVGVPVNTLYALPGLASPSVTKSNLWLTGTNHDTLYIVGQLDLGKGAEILHVPDMAGRYYCVEFVDPWLNVFAYVGRHTTGTRAGDYLISGPDWKGSPPEGVKQIVSPDNAALVIGRVLVERDDDLSTAYGLAKQIQLTLQSGSRPGR